MFQLICIRSGFNVIRRDRVKGLNGGVCMYVKDSIKFKVYHFYHVARKNARGGRVGFLLKRSKNNLKENSLLLNT